MDILFIFLQVIILDGILSIDNAAALAGIAKTLPKKKAPLPKWLSFLHGDQPDVALKVGILGAYIGRGLMLLITGFLIANPWVRVVGALYLLYLVGTHFFNWKKWEPEFKGLNSFWMTVITIEIADLAFSIDNVVAVIALSSHIWIIIAGVCLSIVIMRFAASIFMKLIAWEPLLEHAAYVLIFAIAIELLLKYIGIEIHELVQFGISMGILIGFIVYGRFK